VVRSALVLAVQSGMRSATNAAVLFEQLAQPFCLTATDAGRLETMAALSLKLSPAHRVRSADAWGKSPPWTRNFLDFRRDAYADTRDPRLQAAQEDLDTFMGLSGQSVLESVSPSRRPGAPLPATAAP
jgi:hypothetical protein